jgi:carboxyl-terminal processing protease
VFLIGYYVGQYKVIDISLESSVPQISIRPSVPEGKPAEFSLFWDVWDRVRSGYIYQEEIDDQEMIYGAISGMVDALGDPYTVFLPPEENTQSKEDLSGQFEGVGIQLGYKNISDIEDQPVNRLTVISPLSGMPAEQAGVKAGDLILEVDGESTVDMSLPKAVDLIRGPSGSVVTLTLFAEGDSQQREVPITRKMITVPSVALELVTTDAGQQVAHLAVRRFGDRTNQEWQEAVQAVLVRNRQANFAGIVLDLRGNPGGYFQGAIQIVSEFVSSGTVVQQVSGGGDKQLHKATGRGSLTGVPVVVLINGGSASSSEIVAGALRDLNKVMIVGETSFGKGTVQEADELPGGAGLHVTTYKWLTPSGYSIDRNGIEPDVVVERALPEEGEAVGDNQLERAIEVLLGLRIY